MGRKPRERAERVVVKIDPHCEHCPVPRPRHVTLMEMQPGRDGAPWYLCPRHWFDGLRPNDPRQIGTGRVVVESANPEVFLDDVPMS